MLIEKRIENISVDHSDIVRKTTLTGFYRDTDLVGKEYVDTREIVPGEDVSTESKKIQRIVAQAHVPTVVDRYLAKLVYDNAVTKRIADPSQRNIDDETAARTDLDAKILAYDLFEA